MRIKTLSISAYGHVPDQTLDLHSDSGVTVIHGPNEAGKSTLMRALQDLLFGLTTKAEWPYVSEISRGSKMQVSGDIETRDGASLHLVRRRGRKAVPIGTRHVDGNDLDLSLEEFQAYLGAASHELYESVFFINSAQLAAGAESLLSGQVKDAFLDSALGSFGGRSRVLSQTLQDEAQKLFRPRGKEQHINAGLKRLDALRTELNSIQVPLQELVQLKDETRRLDRQVSELNEQQRVLRATVAELKNILRARKLFDEHGPNRLQLEDLPTPPEGLTHNWVKTAQKTLQDFMASEREVVLLLEPVERQAASIEKLGSPSALLSRRSLVEGLLSEGAGHVDRLAEMASLEAGVQGDAEQLERDLKGVEWEQALEWPDAEDVLLQIHEERSGLGAAQTSCSKAKIRLDELEQQLAGMPEVDAQAPSSEMAERILEEESRADEITRKINKLNAIQENLVELSAQISNSRRSLHPALLNEEARLPSEELITEHRDLLQVLEKRFNECDLSCRASKKKLRELSQQIASQDLNDLTLLQNDLAASRQARDEFWARLANAWGEGAGPRDPDPETADPWSGGLRDRTLNADRMADELLRQSEAQGHQRAERKQQLALEQQLSAEEDDLAKASEALSVAHEHWARQWDGIVENPLKPATMLTWLQKAATFQNQISSHQQASGDLELRASELEEWLRPIEFLFGSATKDPALEVQRIRKRAEDLRSAQNQEEGRQSLAARIAKAQAGLEQATTEQAFCEKAFARALETQGLPTDLTLALLEPHLRSRQALKERAVNLKAKCTQQENLRARIERFDQDWNALVNDLSEAEVPTPKDVGVLKEEWEQALAEDAERRTCKSELKAVQAALNKKQEEHDLLVHELVKLKDRLGVDDVDALDECLVDLAKAFETKEVLIGVERSIQSFLSDVQTVEEPRVLVESHGVAHWDQEIVETDQRLVEVDRQLAERLEERTALRMQLEGMMNETAAPKLEQDIESLKCKLEEHQDEYIRRTLARKLLLEALDRFGRENAPAVRQEASRLMAAITDDAHTNIVTSADQEHLLLEGRDGGLRKPEELSTGTNRQLFLCMRLAYIRGYADAHEPLPVLLDDALVHFDRTRQESALRVLADLGERVQVLLFSCQEDTVSLAQGAIKGLRLLRLKN